MLFWYSVSYTASFFQWAKVLYVSLPNWTWAAAIGVFVVAIFSWLLVWGRVSQTLNLVLGATPLDSREGSNALRILITLRGLERFEALFRTILYLLLLGDALAMATVVSFLTVSVPLTFLEYSALSLILIIPTLMLVPSVTLAKFGSDKRLSGALSVLIAGPFKERFAYTPGNAFWFGRRPRLESEERMLLLEVVSLSDSLFRRFLPATVSDLSPYWTTLYLASAFPQSSEARIGEGILKDQKTILASDDPLPIQATRLLESLLSVERGLPDAWSSMKRGNFRIIPRKSSVFERTTRSTIVEVGKAVLPFAIVLIARVLLGPAISLPGF
jgi:hypothetical protein